MIRFTVYSLLILSSFALQAQYRLQGRVFSAADSSALSAVEVFHRQSQDLKVTDKNGSFSISLPADEFQDLVFFSYQYQSQRVSLKLQKDSSISFYLYPLGEELDEVLIQEKRAQAFRGGRLNEVEGTAVYAGKKSEVIVLENAVANLAANNARQVFAQVVGLNIYENNDAGLQLNIGGRGLDPNRSSNFNVRQNGYDISADVLGYPESYYTPTAEALQEIQVVRGAASLQYGTQFGGFLNFKMKGPAQDTALEIVQRNTVGSFGLFTNFTSLSGTKGKWGYYTFFNYKEGQGWRPNSQFNSRNIYAHLEYNFSDKTQLAGEYTLLNYLAKQPGGLADSQFNRDPLYSNRSRNWFQINWQLYALKFKHQFANKADFSINLFALNAQRKAVGFRGSPNNLNANPITEIDEQNSAGNFINPRDLIVGTFANAGAEIRYLQRYKLLGQQSVFLVGSKYYHAENSSMQGPGSSGIDANFSMATEEFPDYANQSNFQFPNRNFSLFSENIFYLSPKFSLTPGMRFEYIKTASEGQYQLVNFDNAGNPIFRDTLSDNRSFERAFVLFGLGASYKAKKQMEIYANFSQNYRSVTFSDIRTVNPTFIIDPDISDETGFTADLGTRGKVKEKLNYDISLFSLLYNNRIGIILNNRAQRVRKNIGNALIYGAETFVEINWLKVVGKINSPYRLSSFVNAAFTQSRYLASEDNNVVGKSVEFIPQKNLKLGLKGGYKKLVASLQYTYISEQFTDVENSTVPAMGDLREGIIGLIPAYQILDLSLSYKYKRYSLEAGCNNIANESYFTRRATGYPGPGIIPSNPRSFYLGFGIKI